MASFGRPRSKRVEPQVVVRLRRRGVDLQRLGQYLEGATGILQLPLHFAEQREELRVARHLRQRRVELFAGTFEPAEIEIDVGEIEARRHERGIERQRLTKFCDSLPHEFRRPDGSVGDAEEQVSFRRAGIDSQDVLQLADGLVGAIRAGEELGPDAVQFLLRLGRGGVRLKRRQQGRHRDRSANDDSTKECARGAETGMPHDSKLRHDRLALAAVSNKRLATRGSRLATAGSRFLLPTSTSRFQLPLPTSTSNFRLRPSSLQTSRVRLHTFSGLSPIISPCPPALPTAVLPLRACWLG